MTDEKILETLGQLLEPINKRLDGQDTALASLNTAIEALAEGQKDIRERIATKQDLEALEKRLDTKIATATEALEENQEAAKLEIRADIINLNAKIITKVQKHEKSIKSLHEGTGIPDPNKH